MLRLTTVDFTKIKVKQKAMINEEHIQQEHNQTMAPTTLTNQQNNNANQQPTTTTITEQNQFNEQHQQKNRLELEQTNNNNNSSTFPTLQHQAQSSIFNNISPTQLQSPYPSSSSSVSPLIKCLNHNDPIQFCINQYCKNKPFICSERKCPCRKSHFGCQKGDIDFAVQLLEKKIKKTASLEQLLTKAIDSATDQISRTREQIQKRIRNQMKYIELTNLQKIFYFYYTGKGKQYKQKDKKSNDYNTQFDNNNLQYLQQQQYFQQQQQQQHSQSNEFNEFNGQKLSKLWNLINIESQQQQNSAYQQSMQKITIFQQQVNKRSLVLLTEIDSLINQFKNNQSQKETIMLQTERRKKLHMYRADIEKQLFKKNMATIQSQISKIQNQHQIQLNRERQNHRIQLNTKQSNLGIQFNRRQTNLKKEFDTKQANLKKQFNNKQDNFKSEIQKKEKQHENLKKQLLKQQQNYKLQLQKIQKTHEQKIKNDLEKYNYSIKLIKDQYLNELIQDTLIIDNYLIKPLLTKAFNRSINKIQIKFRASMSNFNMKAYYRTCEHLDSTVIICKTQNDKIIGAYTRYCFKIDQNKSSQYLNDPHNLSFIFSGSQNQLFNIRLSSGYGKYYKCIYRDTKKTHIIFGDNQFVISKNNGQLNLSGINYITPKASKQQYLRLTGSEDKDFNIKQWQVYQVQF